MSLESHKSQGTAAVSCTAVGADGMTEAKAPSAEAKENASSARGSAKSLLEHINSPQLKQHSDFALKTMHELNSAPHSCGECWLLLQHCYCSKFVNVIDLLTKYCDVVVYTHYKELITLRGSNTGKIIVKEGAKRVLFGQFEEEAELVRMIQACPERAMVLFPSPDSITVQEWKQRFPALSSIQSSEQTTTESPGTKPLVIVLDATWNLASTLNRRLNLLLRAHAEPSGEIATLTRVRLGRPIHNTIGIIRRLGCNKAKGGIIPDSHEAKVASSATGDDNEQGALTSESDKVSTMHAFIAFLEEYFDIYNVLSKESEGQLDLFEAEKLILGLYQTLRAAILGYHAQTHFNPPENKGDASNSDNSEQVLPKVRKPTKWTGAVDENGKRICSDGSDSK